MNPKLDNVIQQGLRADELAARYRLEDRLPAGMLAQLRSDIDTLKFAIPGTMEARRRAEASTVSEQTALARGYELARGVRTLVRRSSASAGVRKHYGIGVACNPRLHPDVVALLEQILTRAEAEPEEATSVGIVAEDIAALRGALDTIRTADRVQRDLKIQSPKTRQSRQDLVQRVLKAVHRISGAGLTRFANQPPAAEFEALVPRRRRPPQATPTPEVPKVA